MSVEDAKKKAALAAEAKALGMPEWQLEMVHATPDRLVRDVVNDFRRGPAQPSSIAPKKPAQEPPVKGTGWQDNQRVEQPAGIKYIDAMCDTQDALDLMEKLKKLKP